jgi:hypothetical protein
MVFSYIFVYFTTAAGYNHSVEEAPGIVLQNDTGDKKKAGGHMAVCLNSGSMGTGMKKLIFHIPEPEHLCL